MSRPDSQKYTLSDEEEQLLHSQNKSQKTLKKWIKLIVELVFVVGLSIAWSEIIMLPFCNFLFRCGCTWMWKGGIKDCNIYKTGPHCPWCIASSSVAWIPQWGSMLMMVAVAMAVRAIWLQKTQQSETKQMIVLRYLAMLSAGIIAFFTFGTIVGWAFKVQMSYPHFL